MINKEKDKKNDNKENGIVELADGTAHGRLVIRDKKTRQILRNEKG